MDNLNIVIVGVGGQGTLLASRVLGYIAVQQGLDVKLSEVHGMSQRGGAVISYVRMGKKVYSPLIEQAGADYLMAFEELEALRALPYLKPQGTIIVNTQQIPPLPVIVGAAKYPESIIEKLTQKAEVVALDALPMARSAGNERAVNTLLLGTLAARLPFDKQIWLDAITENVPAKVLEANLAAFEAGYTS